MENTQKNCLVSFKENFFLFCFEKGLLDLSQMKLLNNFFNSQISY